MARKDDTGKDPGHKEVNHRKDGQARYRERPSKVRTGKKDWTANIIQNFTFT